MKNFKNSLKSLLVFSLLSFSLWSCSDDAVPLPNVDFSIADALHFPGEVISIQNNSENAVQYEWSIDNQIVSYNPLPEISLQEPGRYTLKLRARNSEGQWSESSQELVIGKYQTLSIGVPQANAKIEEAFANSQANLTLQLQVVSTNESGAKSITTAASVNILSLAEFPINFVNEIEIPLASRGNFEAGISPRIIVEGTGEVVWEILNSYAVSGIQTKDKLEGTYELTSHLGTISVRYELKEE